MASAAPGGARGRRKQAKPQRKVELDANTENDVQYNTILTEVAATGSSMSPDTNHNELSETPKEVHQIMTILHKEGDVPEDDRLLMHSFEKSAMTTDRKGVTRDKPDEDIETYLGRSDTAVIYPEAAENVPSLANGVVKEGDEASVGSEYFIKCPQCQKGCQNFQSLKEHIESSHPDLCPENGTVPTPSAVSPTPSLVGTGGPFGCSQCTASFVNKDQLEKHELLHSPNAQVSCKICNKTFANVYRLQRHMISHDESVTLRKFKCTECDKAFKFKHHLKEHIRIHSGEKPFECGNCGKRFSHSGSYSSHMTSKKCLVMNLKLGRTRAPNSGALDKVTQNIRGPKRPHPGSLNNNINTTNHNAYLPIMPKMPKYSEAAAAAFLQNSLASNPAMHPFYMTPPGILNANGHAISPYSIGHLLEQLQSASSPHKSQIHEQEIQVDDKEMNIKTEEQNLNKSNSSSCADLVMDDEGETKEEKQSETTNHTNNGDLEAVKRILETVNATVTKQFLQANMQKFSDNSSDCQSIRSTHSPLDHTCTKCNKSFNDENSLKTHECDTSPKSEGLAAKLEDAMTTKNEETPNNGALSCNEDDNEHHDDMDSESVTTTDQLTEDGRKVRVRSLISDEQLKILKDNYLLNPRPKREELSKIAEQIGFPVRVVQVWFQNTRARDRREGRIIQVPYNTPSLLPRFPSTAVPSNQQFMGQKGYPLAQSPQEYTPEQPLDLSIKKEISRESSPASSPNRPASTNHHSDSGEEVVNLSHKSSRSPTPFYNMSHSNPYQASNCSSEPLRSPSPMDYNNSSRLAQILAQPTHKLAFSGMGLVPMERLMQFGPPDLNLSQILSNRMSNISPNSDKRRLTCDVEYGDQEDDFGSPSKSSKMSQFVMKSLGSPMLGNQELEIEGQFTCDQCDKAFSKQSSLARHKYEHSGQRPHKCDSCPKAFKHKHHLTEHKRLHSGEKPFQCCKCLKRFSHSGSYSQHMNHRYSYCKPYRE